jgi:hypothetical protein
VRPTIEEPLRADWDLVRAEVRALVGEEAEKRFAAMDAVKAERERKAAKRAAQERVIDFHHQLCRTRVLDPACGTGNFLYVTLDLFKQLESEVLALLAGLGYDQLNLEMEKWSVTPEQFRGIEVKPWAKEIAELVLWIGYLQWQVRQSGEARTIPEPVLKDYRNIECRDAVLAWDGDPELARDEQGKPLTRWDGVSTKPSPVTGDPIPDESKTVPIYVYKNPRRVAPSRLHRRQPAVHRQQEDALGARRRLRRGSPRGARRRARDGRLRHVLVEPAAKLVREKRTRRFGLITTNSDHPDLQQKNRRKASERERRFLHRLRDSGPPMGGGNGRCRRQSRNDGLPTWKPIWKSALDRCGDATWRRIFRAGVRFEDRDD